MKGRKGEARQNKEEVKIKSGVHKFFQKRILVEMYDNELVVVGGIKKWKNKWKKRLKKFVGVKKSSTFAVP